MLHARPNYLNSNSNKFPSEYNKFMALTCKPRLLAVGLLLVTVILVLRHRYRETGKINFHGPEDLHVKLDEPRPSLATPTVSKGRDRSVKRTSAVNNQPPFRPCWLMNIGDHRTKLYSQGHQVRVLVMFCFENLFGCNDEFLHTHRMESFLTSLITLVLPINISSNSDTIAKTR